MATSIYLGNPPPKIKEWIEKNYKPAVDMTKVPLHFVAEEPNATMSFEIYDGTYETSPTGEEGSWTPYQSEAPIILVNVGDKVYFRAGSDEGNSSCEESKFIIQNGRIAANGNIQSLLDRKLERMNVPDYCYSSMFFGCTALTNAPTLPATSLSDGCYSGMFSGCTALTNAPTLPATRLYSYCYQDMFYGCINIPEPKYNMSHMTFDTVANKIKNSDIFGDYYTGTYQVQCSDKILVATYDEDSGEWSIS